MLFNVCWIDNKAEHMTSEGTYFKQWLLSHLLSLKHPQDLTRTPLLRTTLVPRTMRTKYRGDMSFFTQP